MFTYYIAKQLTVPELKCDVNKYFHFYKATKETCTPHLITSVLLCCHELLHPLPSGLHEDDGANLAQSQVLGT